MNLLIFHLHDMGRYCSPYGYGMRTPNMQAFANSSTLFRNAHCAAPTCSPSRAALLTGQTAHQAGMLGLLHRGFDLKDYSQHLASYLTKHSYETAYAGIQHEFISDGKQPCPYNTKLDSSSNRHERDQLTAGAAADYLDHLDGDNPFYLWVGMFYPHRPFLKADKHKYNPDHIQPPCILPDTPEVRQDMADYMESVEHADACFGKVMASLEQNGLREKTIVILTTDHGIAFPEMKCNLTHHGTGVALLMDFPGNASRGRVSDALVSHLDIFPTICDILKLDKPEHLIGESLLPLFEREKDKIREDVFAEVNFHASRDIMRSVRTNRYNYIRIFDEDLEVASANIDQGFSKDVWFENREGKPFRRKPVQLYDLRKDPQERCNLAEDPTYTDILLDMEERLNRWMAETDDPLLEEGIVQPENAIIDPRSCLEPS